jgi:hypothetical protein
VKLGDLVWRNALRNRAARAVEVMVPLVFEVANLPIPAGTDFTEPMEVGRFGLTNAQVIVSGLVTMRYSAGDLYESISIFVAPVARKTPAKSGYLHAGYWNSGSVFVPPSPPAAAEAFGSFHLQDAGGFPLKLWDNSGEQEATAPLGSDAVVDFGVYLSPLSDANVDNTTYQDITVETASVKLLIM